MSRKGAKTQSGNLYLGQLLIKGTTLRLRAFARQNLWNLW